MNREKAKLMDEMADRYEEHPEFYPPGSMAYESAKLRRELRSTLAVMLAEIEKSRLGRVVLRAWLWLSDHFRREANR